MIPAFADPAAHRRWEVYFSEVDRLLAAADADAKGMRDELEMHVVDSMATGPEDGTELDRLNAALTRLGRPIDYLRPLLADELIDRGTRTYRPGVITRGIFHSVLAGSGRTAAALAFGLGYLLLAIFVAMALLKPFWGDHVGLVRQPDGTTSFGIVANAAGAHELLGWWAIPLSLAVAAIIYLCLTLALRRTLGRR